MTLSAPPIFPTEYTAKEIVGDRNLDTFRKHYEICQSGTNQGEFPDRRLNKEIGQGTRHAILETYAHLRSNGMYPNGLTPDGRVKVAIQTKSACQLLMEEGLAELQRIPIEELQAMARRGYHPAVKSVEVGDVSEAERVYQEAVY